jgi:hypothetical protein
MSYSPSIVTTDTDGKAFADYTPMEQIRHAWLVGVHRGRGWLNCGHKSIGRLELEYQAIQEAKAIGLHDYELADSIDDLRPNELTETMKGGTIS